MSWDAYLYDDRGHLEGNWNYTHNCNGMVNLILDPNYEQRSVVEEVFCFKDKKHVSWYKHLDGMSGPDGAAFLQKIITNLRTNPEKFIALNPPNGWGSYESFLEVLTNMRDRVPEYPTKWSTSG